MELIITVGVMTVWSVVGLWLREELVEEFGSGFISLFLGGPIVVLATILTLSQKK